MERLFKIRAHGSTVRREIFGGLTTFFAMVYIIFVNPGILSATGMDMTGVAVATCISAFIGTLLTAFLANAPFAQAPGMGLNAFFTYTCCFTMGYSWQQCLTIVLISGALFFIISVSPLRKKIISAIPICLKSAISAGIGLFITFIGLLNAGIVNFDAGVPALGNITRGPQLLFIIGVIVIALLLVFKVKGAIFLGIVITAVIGFIPTICGSDFFGTFTSNGAIYDITSIGKISEVAFKLDFGGLGSLGILPLITAIVSFTLVDCFDTIGTLLGTAANSGMLDKDGNLPRGDRAMIADSIATCAGACLGTSTVTTFVESSAGIGEGARTGLSSLVVAVMFGLSIFITPLFDFFSANVWYLYSIAMPALVIVGAMMLKGAAQVAWDNMEEAIPCFLTISIMPFAYSISDGIAFGFISYVLIKVFRGKAKEVPVLLYLISLLFILKYILGSLL